MAMDNDLKNKTLAELEQICEDFSEKKYLAKYIFSFIHAKNAQSISDITPVPKKFAQKLRDTEYCISQLKLIERLTDSDGTVKYAFETADTARIESVLIIDNKRKTLCISCQVGCRMGCAFCATGKLGFGRNLTAGEIADQLNHVSNDQGKINNIVYMGMGEPMDNFDEVMRSVRILNDKNGKNIGQRHITISTCGIPNGIARLAEEGLQVRLAVSLNAANDILRSRIMAVAAKIPLTELLEAVRGYVRKTQRRVTFEYCMISNINDSTAQAKALAARIAGIKANVNLIEFNPHQGCEFTPSGRGRIERFAETLRTAGLEVAIRYKRGRKIKGACGQLGSV